MPLHLPGYKIEVCFTLFPVSADDGITGPRTPGACVWGFIDRT